MQVAGELNFGGDSRRVRLPRRHHHRRLIVIFRFTSVSDTSISSFYISEPTIDQDVDAFKEEIDEGF
ncbi:hypothetical protein L1987_36608 [Smallanthus sonchifolius]|uniref:Uncharacterized protein n=1 Tax=Smallanthus sonchifolius TaxID=185202 RepID=A0ACB9HE20_9ASTR|nr:hypothetical protein L1987_36608 [Smallanthus sonchifolius]